MGHRSWGRVEKLIAQPLEILETIHKGYDAKFHSPVPLVLDDGSKFERDCSPIYIQSLNARCIKSKLVFS